jgi:hypothetical protein
MAIIQCPGSEVRHAGGVLSARRAEISRFTNFRTDQDTSKALFSSVFFGSEVRYRS